jgi:hypothetical protein
MLVVMSYVYKWSVNPVTVYSHSYTRQNIRHWRLALSSQRLMEPEGSLPRSQEPSTSPYPEPDRSIPYHPILSP